MKKEYHLKTGLILGLVFAVLFVFPAYLEGRRSILGFIVFGVVTSSYVFLVWLLCGWSQNIALDTQKKSWYQRNKRIILFYALSEGTCAFLFTCFFVLIMYQEAARLKPAEAQLFSRQTAYLAANLNVFLFIINSLILFIYRFITLQRESVQIKIEKEQIANENIRSQFEALRQQLNPHFLFNSLNSLKSLVSTHPRQAEEFIVQLATVYRYLLKHRSRDLVSLESEIGFIKSYIFLLKIRFEDTLKIELNLDDSYRSLLLVPLTLQLLVENAVKHNIISSAAPLTIEITGVVGGYLVVTNKIQIRQEVEGSSNFGLYNLNRQYRFLMDEEITIEKNETQFKVQVPLLYTNKLKEGVRL